ncbi:hypothetical protein BCR33DRAFT_76573 [Rhizoclosmatium globosum]|uniref:Tetratricopeptide repeat protein 29 n=1 Tax=Rhizoclosmatium globosum TaxID=329046 RepID=A0A1Y2CKY7_9FUNG|nr:hypothetical protein BCR33DRAFT_76573 [Rhizoclosmatium globosum]|eukprot:ORY47683.1 hypothetical protein BCR33DRAFT_76573 [Rhizoclosmatium globosum]
MRNRITYSLKRERHVAPVASAAATNFPTAVRQLIRRVENHSKQAEFAQCAKALAELVGLYEETADFKLIEKYATDLVNIALKKLKGGSSHRIASAALLSLGKAHIGRQEFDKAINVLEQYAKYYGRLETPEENRNVSYTSQFQLALAFLKRGEYKQDHFDVTCLQDFDTAYKKLIILQSSFDMGGASPQLRCDVYMNLGVSGGYIGKTEQALTCFQRSLKIALSQNFLESVANAYFNLSNLFRKAGDLTKAYEYLKKDLGINREMNNIEGCLRSQYEMALLLREMHDYDEAITVTNSFIDFAKTISDNESRDKGTAFLRVLEECISQTKRIRVLTDRLANHRRQRGGKREEFGILKDVASLRMSLEQFEAASKTTKRLK